MNHVNNRRVSMTRQMLKDSLCELLEHESIHKISIRTLCERADINRSTFYKYYGSQYDLLKEMEDDLLSEVENSLTAGNEETPVRMTQILVFAREHRQLFSLLLNANIDPEFPRRLLSLPAITRKMNDVLSLSTEGAEESSYLQDFILYGSYEMVRRWVNEGCLLPPQTIAALLEQALRGIGAELE